jgi:hypothetical protein
MHLSPNVRIIFCGCGEGGVRGVHTRFFGLHFNELGLTTEAEDYSSLRPSPAFRSGLDARHGIPARWAGQTLTCILPYHGKQPPCGGGTTRKANEISSLASHWRAARTGATRWRLEVLWKRACWRRRTASLPAGGPHRVGRRARVGRLVASARGAGWTTGTPCSCAAGWWQRRDNAHAALRHGRRRSTREPATVSRASPG